MAAAFCAHWGAPVRGMVVTRYGHGLQAGEQMRRHRGRRGRASVARQREPRGRRAAARARGRSSRRRDAVLPDLGRRLVARVAAAAGAHVRAETRRREFPDPPRRRHPRDQLRAQASVALEGRPARRCRASRARGDVRDLRRARRRRRRDRVGPDDAGPDDAGRRAARSSRSTAIRLLSELAPHLGRSAQWETPKPGDPEFARDTRAPDRDGGDGARGGRAIPRASRAIASCSSATISTTKRRRSAASTRGSRRSTRSRAERTAILSGGETRVVLGEGGGRGGRNTEYLAALALELDGAPGICALAADTDGIDGHGDHAGGIVVPEMLQLGARTRLVARASYWRDTILIVTLMRCGLLLRTGPTRTNVNDFRLILCQA